MSTTTEKQLMSIEEIHEYLQGRPLHLIAKYVGLSYPSLKKMRDSSPGETSFNTNSIQMVSDAITSGIVDDCDKITGEVRKSKHVFERFLRNHFTDEREAQIMVEGFNAWLDKPIKKVKKSKA